MDDIETETPEASETGLLEIVYIVTNPSMPGLVKIGRTSDLEARLCSLSASSGVPEPFRVAYAAYVEDSAYVERALHNAFSIHRMPGREFFRIPAANAIAALSLAEVEQVTLDNGEATERPFLSEVFERGRRGRKPDPAVIDFVSKFRQQYGRNPRIPEMRDKFPELDKSTLWRNANRG